MTQDYKTLKDRKKQDGTTATVEIQWEYGHVGYLEEGEGGSSERTCGETRRRQGGRGRVVENDRRAFETLLFFFR